jgi:hypothetical protein
VVRADEQTDRNGQRVSGSAGSAGTVGQRLGKQHAEN